jgi:hypothetical protein
MDDILKLKNDLTEYAKKHQEFLSIVNSLNEHKVRLSKKIDLMEKKGFDVSSDPQKKELYETNVEIYGVLRDVITESSKSLIFIDEFIDRIKNEEKVLKEEFVALKSCMELIEKARDFNKLMEKI